MSNQDIKVISGVLNELSHAVSETNGSTAYSKSNSFYAYDYVEIDGDRWGNMLVSGSLVGILKNAKGKKVDLHYTEFVRNGNPSRVVAGVQVEGEKLEAILAEDVKQNYSALKIILNAKAFLFTMLWLVVGGVLSIMLGLKTHEVLGWGLFIAGLIGVPCLTRKMLGAKNLMQFKSVLVFAEQHNRIK